MLFECPHTGEGVNEWVNKRVLELLREHRTQQEILSIVKWETRNCGRDTTQDIMHSLNTGNGFIANGLKKSNSIFVNQVSYEEQKDQIEKWVECDKQWWINEYNSLLPGAPKEAEGGILSEMFRNEYVCISKDKYHPEIIPAKQLTEVNLNRYQYIVPNPMIGEYGLTKEGKLSKRCLGNVKRRKFLVIEFDKVLDIDHQCRLHKAINSRSGKLFMLVLSGNKSVHGWYVAEEMEMANWKLMQYAIWVGADPATWPQSQWVRIPGGINEKTKQKQEVIYYKRFVLCPR